MAAWHKRLEGRIIEGENPVMTGVAVQYEVLPTSRVAWDCSPNWMVDFIQG